MRNKRFMLYLLVIFITSIILIVFLQYNSNSNIEKLIKGNEALINEFKILGETQKLETDMLYIETHIYRTVISNDSGYLPGIRNRAQDARARLSKLNVLLLTDSTAGLVRELDSLVEEKLKFGDSLLDMLFTQGQPAVTKIFQSVKERYIMGQIIRVIDQLNRPRQNYLTKLAVDANESGRRARQWEIILGITAMLTCIFTFWYITNRIRQQQQLFDQLNRSEKKAREAGIIKENFMANMSHEIRTPMNAILGFTNLLQKENLNDRSLEFVNSIHNSGESLLAIINDILDFSRIEAGMMRIESNPFSLRELLHSIEIMFSSRILQKNLMLTVNIDNQIPDVLNGDAVRLTQILVNLANNSVKFTNNGDIRLNVKAESIIEDKINISFLVKDTGIGIPPEKIDTIFERFQQAFEDSTRKYGGTGLGLSIVKQLVELQSGTIRVSSTPNVGTEFIFIIPYTVARDLTAVVDQNTTANDEIILDENNTRILVAEDNLMNQSLIRHLLTDRHLDFDIANNGQEAIEQLRRKKYSLVLMDIQMPRIDGYSATMKIRNELKSNIPIIAMTAHAMAGEREKCLASGMNEYVSKPIREHELFKVINDVLIAKKGLTATGDNSESKTLDLGYLKELSAGNTTFEVSMIEQFLQQVPLELEAMQEAFTRKDYAMAAQTAHNMKTSVSFAGLTGKLDSSLDYIEIFAGKQNDKGVEEKIGLVNKICEQAFREAKQYLGGKR